MKLFSQMELKYQAFTNAVKNYLSKTLPNFGTSYGNNTIFGQLINVVTSSVQNMLLYIEDAMTEQNKYTAQRKKSIYSLASQSGYQPFLGKAAGVALNISFVPNNTEHLNVMINNKTPLVCTQNGLLYNILLPQETIVLSLDKDNSSRQIYAVQGRFETQSFMSRGGDFYTQNFNYAGNIDTEYIEVKINGEKWEYCSSVYDMEPNHKQWTYRVSLAGGIDLIFGNQIYGRALKADDMISVTYLLHDGSLGNVDVNTETYFVFNDALQDLSGNEVDGNNIFNITFASLDAVTSGSNSETIHQVKQMIGLNSRSFVLSSADNYKTFINRFAFCGYNRTWSVPGSLVVNSLIMKNYQHNLKTGVDYFSLNENDFKLSAEQKASIKKCIQMSGCQLAGVTYEIIDPIIYKYAMYVYVTLKNNQGDRAFVSNKIRSLVGDFFSNIQSDIFIPKSDIVQHLKNNVEEIDGVDVYFLSEANEKALQTKRYEKTTYISDPISGLSKKKIETIYVEEGTNPNLGLDEHGNIYLENDEQFPVLMGQWDFVNDSNDQVVINDPLIITFR